MEENLERLGVRREDDKLGDAAVEGLGGLVRALLQLLVVGSLLGDVKDGDGELCIRQRECLRVGSVRLRRQGCAIGQLLSWSADQNSRAA